MVTLRSIAGVFCCVFVLTLSRLASADATISRDIPGLETKFVCWIKLQPRGNNFDLVAHGYLRFHPTAQKIATWNEVLATIPVGGVNEEFSKSFDGVTFTGKASLAEDKVGIDLKVKYKKYELNFGDLSIPSGEAYTEAASALPAR